MYVFDFSSNRFFQLLEAWFINDDFNILAWLLVFLIFEYCVSILAKAVFGGKSNV